MLNKDFKEFAALLNSTGVEFSQCHANRVIMKIGGVELPIIGLEEFRANKRASGRAKDLADLESLDGPEDGES